MNSQRDGIAACAAAYYVILSGEFLKKRTSKLKRRRWMLSFNKSPTRYNGKDMLEDLKREPSGKIENFCRMSATDFEYLLNKIGPVIGKIDTNMRKSISVQERLAVTLRFLASGDSFRSLSFLFKFSVQTVSRCVQEVCCALIHELRDEIKLPKTSDEWLKIAAEYDEKWNFPHCLGAIDGKLIVIQCPTNSESELFNYKGTFSIVLMTLVDANHCFTFVDIGCQGRVSDGGVFRHTSLFDRLDGNQLMLPKNEPLPFKCIPTPYVFLADESFALSTHMMKAYPGVHGKGSAKRIFNDRLSRARRVVENVFGIMASVFRVLRKPMSLEPNRVSDITMTCVLLHNFLIRSRTSSATYSPHSTFDTEREGKLIPGSWRSDRNDITSLLAIRKVSRKPGLDAKKIRESFAEYFTTNGTTTPRQDKIW